MYQGPLIALADAAYGCTVLIPVTTACHAGSTGLARIYASPGQRQLDCLGGVDGDVAVEMHTVAMAPTARCSSSPTRGYPESLALADLPPVDQIEIDPGLEGTVEPVLVKAGIPAPTLGPGGARGYEPDMVRAGVEGIESGLAHHGMSAQPVGGTTEAVNLSQGNALVEVVADTGGYVDDLVELNDAVAEGQPLAIRRNAFGEVVRE